MRDNPAPARTPEPFTPENPHEEFSVDIEARQDAILHQAGKPLLGSVVGGIILGPASMGAASIAMNVPIRVTESETRGWAEEQFLKYRKRARSETLEEAEPLDPSSIDRDDVSQVLSDLSEQAPSTQETVCNRILNIYEDLDVSELSAEEIINLQQISSCATELGRDDWVDQAEELKEEYFERVESTPLVSKRATSTLDESITPEEARAILEEREEQLRATSESVFEDVDEETIADMQGAYLKLIWENIQHS